MYLILWKKSMSHRFPLFLVDQLCLLYLTLLDSSVRCNVTVMVVTLMKTKDLLEKNWFILKIWKMKKSFSL
jgi:hypothetical protein